MDCVLARQLLDRGIEPSARHPIRAKLGFHLVECQACRNYHARIQQDLLADLLLQHTPKPAVVPIVAQKRRPWHHNRQFATLSLAVLGLLLVFLVARVATAAYTIRQNVQSYSVPSAIPATTPTDILPTIPAAVPTLMALASDSAPAVDAAQTPIATAVPNSGMHIPSLQDLQQLIPIAPTALGVPANSSIPTLAPRTATPYIPAAGSAPITVLLLGSDRRPDEVGTTRTDTIIVARIDPGLRRVALLSLPRDLIVEIPGYGYGRINAANVYGDLYPELGGGMALTRATVSKLIGVPIDYVVMVDFEGFIGLVDAIGGIDIDVPNALYDGEYPTMDYGYQEVAFDTGLQHMDGARALQYARIRHMDSDFERARRQQSVILAAVQSLRSQNPLQLLDSLTAATSSLRGFITTDLPEDRMIALALRDLAPAAVERYLVDETMVSMNGEGGGCSGTDDYYAECTSTEIVQVVVQKWLGSSR